MNKLHNFLQTTKGRLIFFGIPVLLCITGLIYIFIHISLGFFSYSIMDKNILYNNRYNNINKFRYINLV